MRASFKKAVVIYGPPGSGKGTQAELLAKNYNFIHFDTGRYLENFFRNIHNLKKSRILAEKKLFDSGILNTPSWVLGIVSAATRRVASAGYGIVFSGSPRTMFEAFGDKKHRGLLAILLKLYGRRNIFVIRLNVRDNTSLKRNSNRLICSVCGLPILAMSRIDQCSFCAGPSRRRTLDAPSVIKVRLGEYRTRTYPIISRMKKMNLKIAAVNGEPLPYRVFERIIRAIKPVSP